MGVGDLASQLTDGIIKPLFRNIAKGDVVLFLGAGVNVGCTDSRDTLAPIGAELASLIKAEFFPDESIEADLKTLCKYVENSYSRTKLDQFIYRTLIDFSPNNDVLPRIPLFRWRRIYTTNFDRMVEQVYDDTPQKIQNLKPIYNSQDRQDFSLGPDVPYVKLHGCITRITPVSTLVLTPSDYVDCEAGRKRLFNRLRDDLQEHTILFIGYSLTDPNFHSLFFEVQREMELKYFPRCYAIAPRMSRIVTENWRSDKVEVIDMTASEFFNLASEIEVELPALPKEQQESIDILSKNAPNIMDAAIEVFRAFELIDNRLGYDKFDYVSFYKGNRPNWSIIRSGADAPRTFYDQIMEDVVLKDEAKRIEPFNIAVITAEAGSGKSTLLMRLAYDHACLFGGLCLFHIGFNPIPISALEELYRAKKKRIFLFVDDAADNIGSLAGLAKQAKSLGLPITVICAERKNEWNAVATRLFPILVAEYQLPYLNRTEIDSVLRVLEKNNYLCELQHLTIEERRAVFSDKANQQLLIAMREATEGIDFDKIIQNEYEGIPSDASRQLYLHICSLHRFGVAVRAGLLRRLANVASFTEFESLLEPCERVIIEEYDAKLGEYLYRARHPYIAEVVCSFALQDGEGILNNYLNVMSKMDLGYSSDLYSFRQLVRADEVVKQMPDIEHKRLFFERALELSEKDAMVYQHFGRMELRDENLDEAEKYIAEACKLAPRNTAYKHSYALLLSAKFEDASNEAQKDLYFRRAQECLLSIMHTAPTDSYSYDTYAKNLILKASSRDDVGREEDLKEAHEILLEGIRFCREASYLQTTDATVFQKLGDVEKAKRSLILSHKNNPANIRTTLMLARILTKESDYQTAYNIVNETLTYEKNSPALNLLAAETLQKLSPSDHKKIIIHLKKCFDPEYVASEANFKLAVEYYKAEQYEEAEKIFQGFRRRPHFFASTIAREVQESLLDENGKKRQFVGTVTSLYPQFGFIRPDLIPTDIYFQSKHLHREIKIGMRVTFTVGFQQLGVLAQNMQLEGAKHL
jgi:Flp pilus assembly protein TadD